MSYLYQVLTQRVDAWRAANYPCDAFPAIREILEFATEDGETGQLRYLRRAQFRALETYWYLRLVLDTPKIPDLYAKLFPKPKDRREAMGLTHPDIVSFIADEGLESCLERVKSDNAFVRQYALESLRESLTLDYASYILALAMGAGKTILMGSIVATEFAMAMEYPDGPFVQNALIFAPGKTILSALRELSDVPYDKLLPPRMHKPFAASLKLTFTRDGDKQIPIVWGSNFNVIVTNTEKIRIQKPNVRSNGQQVPLFAGTKAEEQTELANLRLQAVASLPHLAVFSDEAHHTYGQKLLGKWEKDKETGELVFKDDGIKKVRRTIDYLAEETNLIVVINATGTPYFERQPLRDVVVWYGLGEGIRDGVLKELAKNIKVFDLGDGEADTLVSSVIEDFVRDYWAVSLPNGAPARLALYFPNIETRDELRSAVESALAQRGIGTDTILAVDGKSNEATRRQFEAVARNPEAPERVLLLVNMGTEGWNCPSLFATALVRKLANSNNFVLQAATRCLRQVPGNKHPARVYLTDSNRKTLESQLAETYGTSLKDLDAQQAERVEREIVLHRPHLPPLLIKKRVLRYRRKADTDGAKPLHLTVPTVAAPAGVTVATLTPVQTASGTTTLQKVDGGDDVLPAPPPELDSYAAATELAANYHLATADVLAALRGAYGVGADIPDYHLASLGQQIEDQRSDYEEHFEEIDVAIALVKADGFEKSERGGQPVYTARISFAKEREPLYLTARDTPDAAHALASSFHYEGYNFDSGPEAEFLRWALTQLQTETHQIEGVWFTGGITDPAKTDLYAEYLGDDGRWHRYTPDFVLRRADGKHLVVEIKRDSYSPDIKGDLARLGRGEAAQTLEGKKAVALKQWEGLNPDKLAYHVMFADTDLKSEGYAQVRDFIRGA
ncbi:restriction endonuclease subunit R [Ideonella dechloratans]|uniref:Restriction endonuclease subunit R n=1 Tax=Ideonella dechloratans TaxID=36863 RepID=A0A643FCA1_IDEDE|nr:DEAD/DEAH box helicase family protein [Ideonella dechloratans]KAB0581412.1 restriction endonuclease subunit R [Ideonella dechloratans]UFU12377.1 DEAD/DEAH box helicase family protein [Ideonella dechloratans]